MSVLVVPRTHDATVGARFAPVVVDGVLTVWDAEHACYVVHQATWDADAAWDVAESLTSHPNYVSLWTWSELLTGEPLREVGTVARGAV